MSPGAFIPNPGWEKAVAEAEEYREGLAQAAEPAAEHARSFAPVDEGDYEAGIKIVATAEGVFLAGTDFKSHWIEFGTVSQTAQAPLRKGAMAAGMTIDETASG